MRKKIKCLFWISITNRCNFQLSFGCTHLRVRWGQARRHGKRSLEMLTVERADYTQEMDCHYFNSWSVHIWSVCKSWFVLMGQLNIVVFEIFATFAVSFRLVLSVEHEPEIAGPTTSVCTSTTFVNASWQSAGWPWWHVVPLFSRRYCECSISESSLISMPWTWCRSSNQFQW